MGHVRLLHRKFLPTLIHSATADSAGHRPQRNSILLEDPEPPNRSAVWTVLLFFPVARCSEGEFGPTSSDRDALARRALRRPPCSACSRTFTPPSPRYLAPG